MRRLLALIGAVALLGLMAACGGGGTPAGPDPAPGYTPRPAPGFEIVTAPIPGAEVPLSVAITSATPDKDTKLVSGQFAKVEVQCGTQPSAIAEVMIGIAMVAKDQSKNPHYGTDMCGMKLAHHWLHVTGSGKCDGTIGRGLDIDSSTPDIEAVRLYVWTSGFNDDSAQSCATVIVDQHVGWAKP